MSKNYILFSPFLKLKDQKSFLSPITGIPQYYLILKQLEHAKKFVIFYYKLKNNKYIFQPL